MCRRSWKSPTACAAAFVAGVPSAEWGQAVAAYVARGRRLAGGAPTRCTRGASPTGGRAARWALLAPKTVLAATELLMLPNGKPDRLAMIERLNALHQGK